MNPENMIRDNEFDLDDISIGESNESENKSIQDKVKPENKKTCCNWWHDYFLYWHTDSDNSLICLYCNSCGVCIYNISCICCFLCDE